MVDKLFPMSINPVKYNCSNLLIFFPYRLTPSLSLLTVQRNHMLLITLIFFLFALPFLFSTKGRSGPNTAGGTVEALIHQIIIRHIIIIRHSFLHPFLNSAERSFHRCKPPLRAAWIPSFSCWQWCLEIWRVKTNAEIMSMYEAFKSVLLSSIALCLATLKFMLAIFEVY